MTDAGKLARLDRAITRCAGCGDWQWRGKCGACPKIRAAELSTTLSTAA